MRVVIYFIIILIFNCLQATKSDYDSSSPKGLAFSFLINALSSISSTAARPYPSYIAVGNSCSSWISGDGVSWVGSQSRFPGCTSGNINGIAFGNNTWVAVGSTTSSTAGCGIWTSTDGQNWTQRSCAGVNVPLKTIAFGSNGTINRFWAAGSMDTSSPWQFNSQTSTDEGLSWSQQLISNSATSYNVNANVNSIVYNPLSGNFILSYQVPTYPPGLRIQGISGGSWTNGTSPVSVNSYLLAINSSSGLLVATGSNAYTSSDSGSTWSSGYNLNMGGYQSFGTVFGSKFINVSSYCYVSVSSDGITWSGGGATSTCLGPGNPYWSSVAFNSYDNKFVAGSSNPAGSFGYSSTGAAGSWTLVSASIAQTVNAIGTR